MRLKIRAKDGYLHIGHRECPSEITSMFRVRVLSPYVAIAEPFAACSFEQGGLSGVVVLIG